MLVSVLNVAASGYELAATSKKDPDKVRSDGESFDRWAKRLEQHRQAHVKLEETYLAVEQGQGAIITVTNIDCNSLLSPSQSSSGSDRKLL